MPSVNYLQRLGPEYLDLIFEHSRWVFGQNTDIGFEVTFRFIRSLIYSKRRVDLYVRGSGFTPAGRRGFLGEH